MASSCDLCVSEPRKPQLLFAIIVSTADTMAQAAAPPSVKCWKCPGTTSVHLAQSLLRILPLYHHLSTDRDARDRVRQRLRLLLRRRRSNYASVGRRHPTPRRHPTHLRRRLRAACQGIQRPSHPAPHLCGGRSAHLRRLPRPDRDARAGLARVRGDHRIDLPRFPHRPWRRRHRPLARPARRTPRPRWRPSGRPPRPLTYNPPESGQP